MKNINIKESTYSEKEFVNILESIDNRKWEKSSFLLEEYLKKYPKDDRVKLIYVQSLIAGLRFEEANEMIESIDNPTGKDKEKLIDLKIKILYAIGEYDECYRLVRNNVSFYNENFTLVTLLRKKLGLLTEKEYNSQAYTVKQILSYSDDLSIEHIKDHHQNKNYLDSTNIFHDDFDIEKNYYIIKKLLPNRFTKYNTYAQNLTMFKIPRNGYVNNIEVDYIEVISFHNTNEIITMYPYQNKEKDVFYDLTPEKEISDTSKVKTLSRIDKFNQKYGFKS